MADARDHHNGYEPPMLRIDAPLIGRGSIVACAVFNTQ